MREIAERGAERRQTWGLEIEVRRKSCHASLGLFELVESAFVSVFSWARTIDISAVVGCYEIYRIILRPDHHQANDYTLQT